MNPPFRWDQDNPVFFSQTEFKVLKNPKGRFNPDQIVFHDLILVQNPSFALKNPRFYSIRDILNPTGLLLKNWAQVSCDLPVTYS